MARVRCMPIISMVEEDLHHQAWGPWHVYVCCMPIIFMGKASVITTAMGHW